MSCNNTKVVVGDYITVAGSPPVAGKPKTTYVSPKPVLNEAAVKIAVKVIKNFEGCELRAYPDSSSDLSKTLVTHGKFAAYKAGKFVIPKEWRHLSGAPWTIGYGETLNVKEGDVWTQEEADSRLDVRVREFMLTVLKASPNLARCSPEKIAACTSLCYNIGTSAYSTSSVDRLIDCGDYIAAAKIFLLWVKDNGKIVQGLVNRRTVEMNLFLSV